MKRITEVAYEPIIAVYEDETAVNPVVYGCGPAGCDPNMSGHPTTLRVERFTRSGIPHPIGEGHAPTDIELPVSLQTSYANANRLPSCLPWVRIQRDPATFTKCLAEARALGPINNSKQVADLFRKEGLSQDQEVFYVLLLDTQRQCRGVGEISRGARDRVQTPIPDILRLPIVDGAMGFVVVHNHPSGKVQPSEADKEITKAINEAAHAVGVHLFDHVIIGTDKHYSFYDSRKIK